MEKHEAILASAWVTRGEIMTPSAVEVLLDPSRAAEAWPARIVKDEAFREQVEQRRRLIALLDAVVTKIPRPDVTLHQAIADGLIRETDAADLYNALSDMLDDPENSRVVLYLPFEFLPPSNARAGLPELRAASDRFRASYLAAWKTLLHIYDVRANFVDGDVEEDETRIGDHARVVKAAHLIPKLVECGMLAVQDVLNLLEATNDDVLRASILNTLPVLTGMSLLTPRDVDDLRTSAHFEIRAVAEQLAQLGVPANGEDETATFPALPTIRSTLHAALSRIETADYGRVTEERKAWLKSDAREKAVTAAGTDIAQGIVQGVLADTSVATCLAQEANPAFQQALIAGIRQAIETVAKKDVQQGRVMLLRYEAMLQDALECGDPTTRETAATTFRRLHGLGVIDDHALAKRKLRVPDLTAPSSEHLRCMEREMSDIRIILSGLQADTDIAQYVHPTVVVFGSRLKGYGMDDADLDVGVFIRPDTPRDAHELLRAALKRHFAHHAIRGKVIEFWLQRSKENLEIEDPEAPDPARGNRSWVHVLFGGAWEGDEQAIHELREQLLTPYFFETEQRALHLEEMERDALLYRLLHKGYARHSPSWGSPATPHSDGIDGTSTFWDAGYRQTATKLFISRVFLPKLR